MTNEATATEASHLASSGGSSRGAHLGLMIAWSLREPGRVGLIGLVASQATPLVVGRGAGQPGEEPRLLFAPLRPGPPQPPVTLESPTLSRRQLLVRRQGATLVVERVGKLAMTHNGAAVEQATLVPGDLLQLDRQLLLLCVTRGDGEVRTRGPAPSFAFGAADPEGLVGETPRLWQLRDELAFYARRGGHALLLGPSGSGKELCARALHRLSARAQRPFVARNAATLPEGLIDAELFGNERNYPNPGMRERPGLVGEADGGTLFLDEIGEIPEGLQAHLLRLLDSGEYHRLGSPTARRADLRVVGATNRPAEALKHDVAARLALRIHTPGLDERREDIPLLIRALLERLAASDAALRGEFFDEAGPRVDPGLAAALLRHRYTTHLRELEGLLVAAMAGSKQGTIELTPGVRERLQARAEAQPVARAPTREEVEAALARAGTATRAWQELGLSSRDALNRLMKKYGIRIRG
jgi:DNA-binding NtrC family response regulator